MNFLAHIFLSYGDEDLLMGNFLGDFLNNKEIALLPEPMQQGVLLHRHIDSYTDNHREVRKATKMIRPSQGKYAPVVTDVFFDYILTENWELYGRVDLEEFRQGTYRILEKNIEVVPVEKVKNTIKNMIKGDFLKNYSSLAGIDNTMERINRRTSFDNNLLIAVDDLKTHYVVLEKIFNSFFPEIMASTKDFLSLK